MAIVEASDGMKELRMVHRGVIEVTLEQLAWALKLPEGTEVVAMVMDGEAPLQRMLVLVEHAALKGRAEGQEYRRLYPLYTSHTCEHGYERVVGAWSESDLDAEQEGPHA